MTNEDCCSNSEYKYRTEISCESGKEKFIIEIDLDEYIPIMWHGEFAQEFLEYINLKFSYFRENWNIVGRNIFGPRKRSKNRFDVKYYYIIPYDYYWCEGPLVDKKAYTKFLKTKSPRCLQVEAVLGETSSE